MKLKTLNLAMLMALSASTLSLTGCGGEDGVDGIDSSTGIGLTDIQVSFAPVALPVDSITKNDIQFTTEAEVTTATQTTNLQTVGYTKLIATGETNNGETFGAVKNYLGNPIQFADTSEYICNGTNDGVGSGLDHFSILEQGDNLYMISQFECQIGAMYMSKLDQDSTTGALSVAANSLKFIDQSPEFGGFVHCAGQTTPWNSHLGSEEYETDARMVEADADISGITGDKYYDETAMFWSTDSSKDDATKLNPYYYGWTPEVQVDGSTDAITYMKHYSMGRFSHELAYVMPDQKTVYLSDDGENVGLFMFVADTAGDLSVGTLYAAKWNQVSDAGLGNAVMTWIDLGHTDSASIRAILDPDTDITTNDAPKFSDIFATETPNPDGSCPTLTAVNTSAGNECLQVADINNDTFIDAADEVIASRLETRRYAAMQGATTEFRKEEGITFNARDNKLYVAMSEVARGMEDNMKNGAPETKYDLGGNNDIKLDYNKCGGVYELDLAADSTIGSAYVAYSMKGLIAGTPTDYSANAVLSANSCDVNGISMPDNVTFLEGSDVLVIGEDSSLHENNMMWSYNIKDKSLTRIFTTPLGAETTSPFWHKDVNGFSYMTTVTQHPDIGTVQNGETETGVIGTFNFN
jgi:secreted PhoX family phosphatase